MPSHALTGDQSKKVPPGHGKVGYVQLSITVPPEYKDGLLAVAAKKKTWVMEEVRTAIANHLEKSL